MRRQAWRNNAKDFFEGYAKVLEELWTGFS